MLAAVAVLGGVACGANVELQGEGTTTSKPDNPPGGMTETWTNGGNGGGGGNGGSGNQNYGGMDGFAPPPFGGGGAGVGGLDGGEPPPFGGGGAGGEEPQGGGLAGDSGDAWGD